jgi:hypothetical protein
MYLSEQCGETWPLIDSGHVYLVDEEPPEDVELQQSISRTLDLLESSEQVESNLKVGDVAIIVGQEQPSAGDAVWQGLKRVMPFVKSRDQKLKPAVDAIHGRALQEYDERLATDELTGWLRGLSAAEKRSLVIEQESYGDPYLSPLRLRAVTAKGEATTHSLGYHFGVDWDDLHYQNIPQAVRQRMTDRKTFWTSLGVETGPALETFIDEHFEKVEIDLADEFLPEELYWLAAVDRDAFCKLEELQLETERKMYLWRLIKSPRGVVEDVLNIAINTQEQFVSTWLEPWTKRVKTPVILDSDVQAILTAHHAATQSLRSSKRLTDYQREVLLRKLDARFERDADFNGSLENMQRLRSIALGIEIEGACDPAQAEVMDRVNELMDLDLSGQKVSDRLQIDTVLHTSEGIRKALKALVYLIPGAEAVRHAPIKEIADAAEALGSGDDFVGEIGEMDSLHRMGNTWMELIKRRFGVILPVGLGSVALGTQIQNIEHGWGGVAAALTYSVTTFATTAATLALNTRQYAKSYQRLAEQGKLIEQPYLSKEKRDELFAMVQETPYGKTTRTRINEIMDALISDPDISDSELDKRISAIEEAARAGRPKEIIQYIEPTRFEAYRAAYQEVFGINPTREGKLMAMPAMLLVAGLLGGTLLKSPLIFVPFGMGEVFGGLGLAKWVDMRENANWKMKVDDYTRMALAPEPSAL